MGLIHYSVQVLEKWLALESAFPVRLELPGTMLGSQLHQPYLVCPRPWCCPSSASNVTTWLLEADTAYKCCDFHSRGRGNLFRRKPGWDLFLLDRSLITLEGLTTVCNTYLGSSWAIPSFQSTVCVDVGGVTSAEQGVSAGLPSGERDNISFSWMQNKFLTGGNCVLLRLQLWAGAVRLGPPFSCAEPFKPQRFSSTH